ncbi:hypothetical protein LBBP_03468 [Leptospira borgpetersenii serovar Ballum]|uniref:Uncharacterized protein n=1 Tax=Leptospira borgpetersenii serovar Ballum TaxID=280505 RepID=A0A0S2IVI1_LEPBO|nr:hypothetical protein LBBP_03468 [Leptospira borgpetersenii serovar Ballum]
MLRSIEQHFSLKTQVKRFLRKCFRSRAILAMKFASKIIEPVNQLSLKQTTLKFHFEFSVGAKGSVVFHELIGSRL